MLQVAQATTKKLLGVLAASNGLQAAVAELTAQQGLVAPPAGSLQIVSQNVAPELSEHSTVTKYPVVYIYCSKVTNSLKEKFRRFSGNAEMIVDARVSQDRLEEIESKLHIYADAIAQVLDSNRGDWGDGVFYGGGYEVGFGGVKQGGRNFIQAAKVSLVLEVSSDE